MRVLLCAGVCQYFGLGVENGEVDGQENLQRASLLGSKCATLNLAAIKQDSVSLLQMAVGGPLCSVSPTEPWDLSNEMFEWIQRAKTNRDQHSLALAVVRLRSV
jgi:hypothetical protein